MAARSSRESAGLSADDINKMLSKKMRGYHVRRPEARGTARAADAGSAQLASDEAVQVDADSPSLDYLRAKFLRRKGGAAQSSEEAEDFVAFATDAADATAETGEVEDEALPAEDDLELVEIERDDDNLHADLGRDRRVIIVSKSKKKIIGAQG
jgi:hypothetical protein